MADVNPNINNYSKFQSGDRGGQNGEHTMTQWYAVCSRHTLDSGTLASLKWKDGKEVPCKQYPKENWSGCMTLRENDRHKLSPDTKKGML